MTVLFVAAAQMISESRAVVRQGIETNLNYRSRRFVKIEQAGNFVHAVFGEFLRLVNRVGERGAVSASVAAVSIAQQITVKAHYFAFS